MTLTVSSVCRAKNPALCRVHGTPVVSDLVAVPALDREVFAAYMKPAGTDKERFAVLKSRAKELNARVHSVVPDGVSQEEWDAETERQVVAFGEAVSAEAEAVVGLSDDEAKASLKEHRWWWEESAKVARGELTMRYANAYKEVLGRIRVFGGEVTGVVGKPEDVEKFVSSVDGCYPKAWVKLSNEKAEVVDFQVDTSQMGGAYGRYSPVEGDAEGSFTPEDGFGAFTLPERKDFEATMKVLKPYLPEDTVVVSARNFDTNFEANFRFPIREDYDEGRDGAFVDGKPVGDGWEHSTNLGNVSRYLDGVWGYTPQREALEKALAPTWNRAKKVAVRPSATLTFNRNSKVSGTDVYPVAIHEFGHRMEEVLPNNVLPRLERAFLLRRSGKTGAQEFQRMRNTPEGGFGHNAKLVDDYMGRDYFGGKAYELFTTGIESLMGGSYGGLRGFGPRHTKKDAEHRNFVLGVLASV